jgi:hypothetical protein
METVNTPPQNTTMDMGALLDKLLTSGYMPEHIRNEYWVVCSNSLKLSNLSQVDIYWLMNQFDLLELRTIRSLRGHAYNTDFVRFMGMLKQEYFANLNRAKDGFERKTQATQIYSQITTEGRQDPIHSTGFFAQVKRFLGGQ